MMRRSRMAIDSPTTVRQSPRFNAIHADLRRASPRLLMKALSLEATPPSDDCFRTTRRTAAVKRRTGLSRESSVLDSPLQVKSAKAAVVPKVAKAKLKRVASKVTPKKLQVRAIKANKPEVKAIEIQLPKEPKPAPKKKPVVTINPLPGREEEFEEIRRPIESALRAELGCCLYVSGVPGTGKTATVRLVLRNLLQDGMDFDWVEINGMKVAEPGDVYSVLWRKLGDKRASSTIAMKRLDAHFKTASRPCVVVLDELDLLLKKRQSILYHFFEWPGKHKLIVIGIANTMDLPERHLAPRIASRLGQTRCNFAPYSYPQLMRIIGERLAGAKGRFDDDAIEYCARKVGAVSGDARRAIALAKRAVSWLTGQGGEQRVGIREMEQAIQHTMSTSPVQIIAGLVVYQRALLLAILLLSRQGIACTIDAILEHCMQLSRSIELPPFTDWRSLMALLNGLVGMGIVKQVANKTSMDSILALAVHDEDVTVALKGDSVLGRFAIAAVNDSSN